ncbi:UDP-N-acetylmuramate dehydrogenase [Vibrio fluvialis]
MIIEFLEEKRITFKENIKLSNYTYCKVGGVCELVVYPDSKVKLQILIQYLSEEKIKYTIVGDTSNMIFLDDVKYGLIISTKLLNEIDFKNSNTVEVYSGANLSDFLRNLYLRRIEGFEGLEGIPGTVGGAVFMNAGAYGYEISTYIKEVHCIKKTGELVSLYHKDCNFSQRDSIFRQKKNLIIVSVTFNMNISNDEKYYEKIENFHTARHCYQEFVLPNAGSVFTAKRCVYEELCDVDWKYKAIYKLLTKLLHNRVVKIFYGRTPNRRIVNNVTIKYFKLDNVKNAISKKHINMFANQGCTSWDLIDYIVKMKSILKNRVVLENEIVTDTIVEEYTSNYKEYKTRIEKVYNEG